MKKFWNFIQNEDTSETELLFNGPISEDTWWGDVRSDRVYVNVKLVTHRIGNSVSDPTNRKAKADTGT